MNNKIKEKALKLSEKYNKEYHDYCVANPGYIMHGASSKADALRKASFAESLDDLRAMERCFEIQNKAMGNAMNGFRFYKEAISELIKIIENKN